MSDNIDDIEDGGPAFPKPGTDECIDVCGSQRGMSLRDWFAGQALAGICAIDMGDGPAQSGWEEMAAEAYFLADAMLAERKRVRG